MAAKISLSLFKKKILDSFCASDIDQGSRSYTFTSHTILHYCFLVACEAVSLLPCTSKGHKQLLTYLSGIVILTCFVSSSIKLYMSGDSAFALAGECVYVVAPAATSLY